MLPPPFVFPVFPGGVHASEPYRPPLVGPVMPEEEACLRRELTDSEYTDCQVSA